MNVRVLALLLRPSREQVGAILPPIVAFASVTALILGVLGGAQTFWSWPPDDYTPLYQSLAALALVLLVVPLATLGGAAARLSARRRDERLSTLRLLGVSPFGVGAATVAESTMIAAIGVFFGIGLYFAMVPALGLLWFRGAPLGATAILLAPQWIAAVAVGALLLAALSALATLRQVVISPLGVRMRAAAPRVRGVRAVVFVVALGATFALIKFLPAGTQVLVVTIAVLAGLFGGGLALLNLIGPWVMKLSAGHQLRKAETPERLLAARMVLDDPKATWRQVSGVAMASFMAVFAGTAVSLMDSLGAEGVSGADLALTTDIRTGLIITLVGSFLMVAASVGVTQASSILDHRPLHKSLHLLGMQLKTVDAARRRAVMAPLLVTALGSVVSAAVLVFPLLGIALIIAPLSLLTIAAVVAAGIGMVWLSTRVTRPLLAQSFAAA